MSSYNYIEKIKYTKNPSDVVALQEYILFQDDNAKEKFVVFKFMNNLNQQLYSFKFEVLQYDAENNLLERSIAVYDKFVAESNSRFVPNAKLQVNYECRSIIVNLVLAEFDRVKWENGEFSDNSYKFEKYASGAQPAYAPQAAYNYGAPRRQAAAAAPYAPKAKRHGRVVFSVKNVSNKNAAVLPKVFNIIAIVLVLAFVVGSLFLFRKTSPMLYIDGYDLERTSDATVSVLGYDGKVDELTLPAQIGGYTVTRVKKDAFGGSSVKTVVFENTDELTLERNAFANCKSLTSVSSSADAKLINITGGAFAGCTALESVNLPSARLLENSLAGATALKNVAFGDSAVSLYKTFGLGENDKIQLTSLTAKSLTRITGDFFKNVVVSNLDIDYDKCTVEYGALKDLGLTEYTYNDYCEAVGGELRSLKVIDKKLVLPASVTKISANKFMNEFKTVEYLKVESAVTYDNSFYGQFTNLKTFEIVTDKSINSSTIGRLGSISTLVAPVLKSPLHEYVGDKQFDAIVVTGTGEVTQSYFSGVNVKSLTVNPTVKSVAKGAFTQINSLEFLSVPSYADVQLKSQYDGLTSIPNLEVTSTEGGTTLRDAFFADLTALKTLRIGEGFTSCGQRVVARLNELESVVFPSSITTYGGRAIQNCDALVTVVVDFTNVTALPETYSAFNDSASVTKNLCVTFGEDADFSSFFDAECANLERLSLTCAELGTDSVLSVLRKLHYLELHVGGYASAATLDKLFRSEGSSKPVALRTLILDSKALPAGFLAVEEVGIQDVVLVGLTGIRTNPFTGLTRVNKLYLPATLTVDSGLMESLGEITIGNLYVEGKQPTDVEIPQSLSESEWESNEAQNKFYDFTK